MTQTPPVRTVNCPTCKGPSRYAADNAYRPFCSERCQSVDFGAWASERFRVEAPRSSDEPDGPPATSH
jgi:uncharacterized protein